MDGDVQRCEKEVHCACQRTLCDAPEGTHPLTCKKIIGERYDAEGAIEMLSRRSNDTGRTVKKDKSITFLS